MKVAVLRAGPDLGGEVLLVGVPGVCPHARVCPFCSQCCSIRVVLLWHHLEIKDELCKDLTKQKKKLAKKQLPEEPDSKL